MLDSEFVVAFTDAANSDANKTACGTTIWNYVDADLHIDGFAARIGEHYESWFNDMVDQFLKSKHS